MYTVSRLLIAAVLIFSSVSTTAQTNRGAINALADYFDLLASGNLESAEQLWKPSILERSKRFGIEFEGPLNKIDCTSPIVQDMPGFRDYLNPPARQVITVVPDSLLRLDYQKLRDAEGSNHSYYLEFSDGYFWLTVPHDFHARAWPLVTSRYFRIHCHPARSADLNGAALEAADAFVEAMCDTLDLPTSARRTLEDDKIEYFLANSDSTIRALTGHMTKGMLDLPTNDIISAVFPHFHEVVHLLVNIKLQRLPLYTLPLYREGLAVRYGGRWGRSAASLMDLGVFLHREEIVEFDSVLTEYNFNTYAGADIAYPVAGLFAFYVLDRVGMETYLQLYREFSGKKYRVWSFQPDKIKSSIAEAVGQADWDAVRADFEMYFDERLQEHAVARPGLASRGDLVARQDGFEIIDNDQWYSFSFKVDTSEVVAGSLFWGIDDRLAAGNSALYREHFGNRPFDGFRYAVRFDRNEAGLYDYASNQLLAKYIWGITPSDDYIDASTSRVQISFRKSVVTGSAPTEENVYFLSR